MTSEKQRLLASQPVIKWFSVKWFRKLCCFESYVCDNSSVLLMPASFTLYAIDTCLNGDLVWKNVKEMWLESERKKGGGYDVRMRNGNLGSRKEYKNVFERKKETNKQKRNERMRKKMCEIDR